MDCLLIVEGEEDKTFFYFVLQALGMDKQVDIRHDKSGKSNALNTFGAKLQQLTPASKSRIGLVVDADQYAVNPDGGFASSRTAINEKLQAGSFNALAQAAQTSGFIAQANGKPHVRAGAWVMPDNGSDGYLEHFASRVVSTGEEDRLRFAAGQAKAVGEGRHGGPAFAFKPHHLCKAEIGTWLAWSQRPRISLGVAVREGLLDLQHPQFQNLTTWLKTLYS
jgi:hypothetical protein